MDRETSKLVWRARRALALHSGPLRRQVGKPRDMATDDWEFLQEKISKLGMELVGAYEYTPGEVELYLAQPMTPQQEARVKWLGQGTWVLDSKTIHVDPLDLNKIKRGTALNKVAKKKASCAPTPRRKQAAQPRRKKALVEGLSPEEDDMLKRILLWVQMNSKHWPEFSHQISQRPQEENSQVIEGLVKKFVQ